MYKKIIRPLLFLLPPETVHHVVVKMLHAGYVIPGVKQMISWACRVNDPLLETELFGIRFPNKVGLAAGFDKQANLYNHLSAFGFGHIEVGTVNPLPQPGNPKPRLFRLKKDQALINRMGFNNPGVDAFVKNLRKNKPNIIIGGNIGKNTLTPNDEAIADYLACFEKLYPWVDYFVINVSCPNIEGLGKLQDKDELIRIIDTINAANNTKPKRRPVLLKISPDLTEEQLDDTLAVVKKTGIDGIIATNTTTTRQGLSTSESEINNIGRGGLSGKPLRERATAMIASIVQKTGGTIPVIGVGGIMSAKDALDKLEAGASLVQIYTGFIYEGPGLVKRINQAVLNYLKQKPRK
ncbi:MAG: quinone-dependent dihydroorotate dehydrogenase [Bacteroidota bacterium]